VGYRLDLGLGAGLLEDLEGLELLPELPEARGGGALLLRPDERGGDGGLEPLLRGLEVLPRR
jgi:hypothetical protein